MTQKGDVGCWGANDSGQLGRDAATKKPTPSLVFLSSPSQSLSSLENHTCALLENGKAACWGKNDAGQLGDGTTNDSARPVEIPGVEGMVSVSAGAHHSCALEMSGKIRCWGSNDFGQLGDGTTNDRLRAGSALSLSDIQALSCGARHTCALMERGDVFCWGLNYSGQLGTGTNVGPEDCGVGAYSYACSTFPEKVTGLPKIKRIYSGWDYSCAIVEDGRLFCWGANWDGQLGTGKNVWIETCGAGSLVAPCSATPVAASVVKGKVQAAALGKNHICALLEGGKGTCWGSNEWGQLGSGNTKSSKMPVAVSGLSHVIELSAGENHTCALLEDGKVTCWGSNEYGQLGAGAIKTKMSCGNTPCSPVPVDVTGL